MSQPASARHVRVIWLLSFSIATMAVRGIVAESARLAHRVGAPLVGIAAILAVARYDAVLCYALAAPVVIALVLAFRPSHPKYLKRLGWSLVAGNLITIAVLVAWGLSRS